MIYIEEILIGIDRVESGLILGFKNQEIKEKNGFNAIWASQVDFSASPRRRSLGQPKIGKPKLITRPMWLHATRKEARDPYACRVGVDDAALTGFFDFLGI
jgi:hypothetical protein